MILHRSHIYGVVGEFETPEKLIHAVEKVREAGYRRFEAFSPFPVEGLSQAMGLKRNLVPLITLIGGLTGGIGGFGFQYWVAAITYPLNIGGNPIQIGRAPRLNSSHGYISYAVFCLEKNKHTIYCLLAELLWPNLQSYSGLVTAWARCVCTAQASLSHALYVVRSMQAGSRVAPSAR